MRSNKQFPLEQLAPMLLGMPAEEQRLNLETIFGNDQPVELEVGFGKGSFLVESATKNPQINYLGIEIDKGLQLYVATRLLKRSFTNTKVLQGDGYRLLQGIEDGALQAVHVYFPDPWWKKRHRKRRVFTEAFVEEVSRVLTPRGTLYIATDVAEYFQVMISIMTNRIDFEATQFDRSETKDLTLPMTNFERKAVLVNRPVWRATFVKRLLIA